MRFIKPMSRSVFPVRYSVKGSFNLGEICPIGKPLEVVPGDEFKLDIYSVIRMATPIAPIMDDIDYEISAFFVPLRLVGSPTMGDITNPGYIPNNLAQGNFEKIIGNGTGNPVDWQATDNELYQAPTATWIANNAKSAAYTTIGEALGLGLGMGTAKTQTILAYPLYGYNLIYNEHYRNENVEAAARYMYLGSNLYGASGTATATSGTDGTYNHSLSVAYKHSDYYLNAVPSPTKGAAISLPLGTTAPLTIGDSYTVGDVILGSSSTTMTSGTYHNLYGRGDGDDLTLRAESATTSDSVSDSSTSALNQINLYTDLSSATAATINSFIEAYNIQKLLMNDIKGTRYFEILQNHFGVRNEDLVLYRPEILSINRGFINVSPVVQQSGASASTSSTDQGNYLGTTGAYSFTTDKTHAVSQAFGEYGYIYFLIVCRQRNTYGQGIPKMFLRSTRFDFFFPELARIGYQAIDNVELNADETIGAGVFGYQPAWEELRDVSQGNQVFGFLNPAKSNSLDYWTLAENRSTTPTLEMAYLKQDRTNLARALTIADTGPDFIMDSMIVGKKSTLVPIANTPKLFD